MQREEKERREGGEKERKGEEKVWHSARAGNYGGRALMTNEKFTRPLMHCIVITYHWPEGSAGSLFQREREREREYPGAIYRPDGAIRDSGNRKARRANATSICRKNPQHSSVFKAGRSVGTLSIVIRIIFTSTTISTAEIH